MRERERERERETFESCLSKRETLVLTISDNYHYLIGTVYALFPDRGKELN